MPSFVYQLCDLCIRKDCDAKVCRCLCHPYDAPRDSVKFVAAGVVDDHEGFWDRFEVSDQKARRLDEVREEHTHD